MNSMGVIKHIEFWVSDLKHSMKFYKGIFIIIGWNYLEKNAFSNGQTKIYFVEQDVKIRKVVGPRHVCFLASSRKVVDRVGEFLLKSEGDIIRGPLNLQYKDRNSYAVDFRDPDGYIIEVATKSVVSKKKK